MSFKKSIKFNSDPAQSIKLVRELFLPLGFKITYSTNKIIELATEENLSTKSKWWKQSEEALVCITKISFSFTHSKLHVEGDFSELSKNIKYLPIYVEILLTVIMVAIDIRLYQQGHAIPLFIFLPLIALTACIAGALAILPGLFMKRTATRILDNLIEKIKSLE